ncbi:transcriptional regulator, AsnC family protein [Candidatus Scalindua japonica]|uniref:Transcriptional regulator, AsnC family protein n=1 Tax=Candidatus Scalindua japonica TaxID=1284222 RepID=A0A286U054_9BACT|nr:Lrp/AsnC family transcriptional regulator [Candidatus Scalindua japonica]GAX61525.1 transcriptional regulator, AsnC family protein [Candidatus Scalindua japonica]
MKLTKNEKGVLKLLVKDPLSTNSDIANKLKLTAQGVGKIRNHLNEKDLIRSCEMHLDYEKLGLGIHAVALIKILPSAFNRFKNNELDKVIKPKNAIRSYSIQKTDVTHIIKYAFKNLTEYDTYFRSILSEFRNYVEIKDTFILSSEGIMKSSSADLFSDVLDELAT